MIKVSILAGPLINWDGFVDFVTDATGKSPTRCLDKYKINLDSPLSFLASLKNLRSQEYNPWKDNIESDLLNHSSFIFGVYCDYSIADNICGYCCHINKSLIELDRLSCILILSGTVLDWKLTLPESMLKRTAASEVFTTIYTLFKNTDLRNLWLDYEPIKDGNIILLRKK